MKRSFTLLIALCWLGLLSSVNAQTKVPTTKRTTSLTAFNNVQHLTVVGDSGLVMYSADYGRTWQDDTSATTRNLRFVSGGVNANVWKRFAVGDTGTFMVSNGDQTNKRRWVNVNTGTRQHLNHVVGYGSWFGGEALLAGDSGTILYWRDGRGIVFRARITNENLLTSYSELLTTTTGGITRVQHIFGATNGKAYFVNRTQTTALASPDTTYQVTEFNFDSLTTADIVGVARQSYNGDFFFFAADGVIIRSSNFFDANTRSFRRVNMNGACGPVNFRSAVGVNQAWNVVWVVGGGADGKLVSLNASNSNARWICSNVSTTASVISLFAIQPSNQLPVLVGLAADGTVFSSRDAEIKPAGLKPLSATTFCKGTEVAIIDSVAGNYSYQWFRNGVAIPNATSATILAKDSGTYTLRRRMLDFLFNYNNNTVPTTFYGPDTMSAGVRLQYLPAPALPVITAIGSDSLNATVSGSVKYRWLRDGAPLSDTIDGIRPTVTGRYRVVAYNNIGCGSDTSAAYNFYVCSEIARNLNRTRDTAICRGQSVQLRYVPATGITPQYQWFRNEQAISAGGNNAQFSVIDSGSYYVRMVINNCLVYSDTILVDVDAVPTAQTLPVSGTQTICGDDSLVIVAPPGYARYRWFTGTGNNPTLFKDTNSNRLVLRQVVSTLRLRVLTGAGCQSPISSNSLTTILAPVMPTTFNFVNDTTICTGSNLLFRYTAPTGVTNARYQWFKNTVSVATGGTNNLLTVTDSGAYQLRVVVGTCTTFTNTLRVALAPVPTAPTLSVPTTNTICSGDSLVVQAPAGFARYRWVTGTTGTTIYLDSTADRLVLRTAVSGLRLRVGNAQGCFSPVSAPFNTTLTTRPAKPALTLNNNTITATITPSVPGVVYRWYRDGVLISGAVSATYTATLSGTYRAVAVNIPCASDTSDPLNVVSLAGRAFEGTMRLAPNPAAESVTLTLDGLNTADAVLTITDLQGRQIKTETLTLSEGTLRQSIDLTAMPKGMYLVTIRTAIGTRTERLAVR